MKRSPLCFLALLLHPTRASTSARWPIVLRNSPRSFIFDMAQIWAQAFKRLVPFSGLPKNTYACAGIYQVCAFILLVISARNKIVQAEIL